MTSSSDKLRAAVHVSVIEQPSADVLALFAAKNSRKPAAKKSRPWSKRPRHADTSSPFDSPLFDSSISLSDSSSSLSLSSSSSSSSSDSSSSSSSDSSDSSSSSDSNNQSTISESSIVGSSSDQLAERALAVADAQRAVSGKRAQREGEAEAFCESSKFHGGEESFYDWRGRTFMATPPHLLSKIDNPLLHCRAPQRLEHTWRLHSRAVTDVQLFPKSGHLVLSASMDGKVRIFEYGSPRALKRTYRGHSGGVVAVEFNADGRSFVSSALDGWVKIWDTETGQCRERIRPAAVCRVVRYHPAAEQQHTVFVAGHDICQYDLRRSNAEPALTYQGHLRPVNAISFIDDDRRFVSTSDDKTIRFWDVGIPREIRRVQDPEMQSMPSSAVHPLEPYVAFQSLDNRVLVFEATGRFRIHPDKKQFRGHQVTGYACQIGFSPDGRFLTSGSFARGHGSLCVWDWKRTELVQNLRVSDTQPCIGCRWHPVEPSSVVTWSWDGEIKAWR